MKKLVLVTAALAALAGPALAQGIEIGPGGVRVDPGYDRRDRVERYERREERRDWNRRDGRRDWERRRAYRDRDDDVVVVRRRGPERCRYVTVIRELRNGDEVRRRIRRCD